MRDNAEREKQTKRDTETEREGVRDRETDCGREAKREVLNQIEQDKKEREEAEKQ